MQCDRLSGERRAQDQSGKAPQDLLQRRALKEGHLGRRTKMLDDSMDDRGEQRRLVIEAVIERALRDASARGYRFDGCRSVALCEKQIGRDFQDSIAQLQGGSARRPSPMAYLANRGAALSLTGRDKRNRL